MTQPDKKKNKTSALRKGVLTAAFCLAALGSPLQAIAQDNMVPSSAVPDKIELFEGGVMQHVSSVNFSQNFADAIGRENNYLRNPDNAQLEANYVAQFSAIKGMGLHIMAQVVNKTVNDLIQYKSDDENYGVSEYWASPVETIARLSGDCEDYALLKYLTLRRLGIPANRLFIGIVDADSSGTQDHGVLIMNVAKDGQAPEFVVMSNGSDDVYPSDGTAYAFYSMINENGAWAAMGNNFSQPHRTNTVTSTDRVVVALLTCLALMTLLLATAAGLKSTPEKKSGPRNNQRFG